MGAALVRRWRALGLRWQLVVLNVVVIAVTVVLIIVLMHNIAQQEFMVIMHAAGQPVDPAAGQRAYDAAVELQIYPTLAVAALVAVGLSFAAVTLALRPLTAVRDATRQMARGDAPAPIATSRRDEIGGVADSVNELAQSLRRLEELRRQVTNDVAHELRTPLHNLLGLIEGMRDGVIPPSPARLQQAHMELDRLIALVEDLRGLADAQLASDRMSREPLNLEALVRDVVLGFDSGLRQHDLSWRIVATEGDLVIVGDAGRLGQVVGNIVDNAIRYAQAGSTISLTMTRRGEFGARCCAQRRREHRRSLTPAHLRAFLSGGSQSRARQWRCRHRPGNRQGAGRGSWRQRRRRKRRRWRDRLVRAATSPPEPRPTALPEPRRSIGTFDDAATRA